MINMLSYKMLLSLTVCGDSFLTSSHVSPVRVGYCNHGDFINHLLTVLGIV